MKPTKIKIVSTVHWGVSVPSKIHYGLNEEPIWVHLSILGDPLVAPYPGGNVSEHIVEGQ